MATFLLGQAERHKRHMDQHVRPFHFGKQPCCTFFSGRLSYQRAKKFCYLHQLATFLHGQAEMHKTQVDEHVRPEKRSQNRPFVVLFG